MPSYNPTDSRFLTLAQTRTNNGTRDVKLILDTIDKVFYTLDDDGVFDAVDNETAATIVTLSVGTLEGDGENPITIASDLVAGDNKLSLTNERVQLQAELDDEGTLYDTTLRVEYSNITANADGSITLQANSVGEGSSYSNISMTNDEASVNISADNGAGSTANVVVTSIQGQIYAQLEGEEYTKYSQIDAQADTISIEVADGEYEGIAGTMAITYDTISIAAGTKTFPQSTLIASPYGDGSIRMEHIMEETTAYVFAAETEASLRYDKLGNDIQSSVRAEEAGITLSYMYGTLIGDNSGLQVNEYGISVNGLPSFDDDATASGLTAGQLYITTGDGAAPLNVAGILMVKL